MGSPALPDNSATRKGPRFRQSEETREKNNSSHKRRRKNERARSSSTSSSSAHHARRYDPLSTATTESTQMWVDKYAPLKSSDLVIAPKKVKEVQSWLDEALLPGNCKFLILVGSPGIGKSTTVQCLAREMDLEIAEWKESLSAAWQPDSYESVEYESPIRSFETFLTQNAVGYNALAFQKNSSSAMQQNSSHKKSIVLLEDLPYCHNNDASDRLRESLTKFILGSVVPTVLIFSDVAEGKHRPDDLERLVESNILYSQLVRIMTVPAATKARLKRCLESVAKSEGIRLTSALHDDLHLQSGGDVRHALMTLQFDMAVTTAKGTQSEGRDHRLSAFHALGRLLYAKREEKQEESGHDRAPLQFDPEKTVERSGMDVSRVMEFVLQNGADLFTDIDELCGAWQSLSDAALWMHTGCENGSDPSTFPTIHATSMAGRTVANYNKHPAATKFRQLGAPPVWKRQARENFDLLKHQIERQAGLGNVRWSVETSSWAQERVSYMRMISPQENIGLQSFFLEKAQSHMDVEAEMAEKVRQEQLLILQSDDIEDFPEEKEASLGMPPTLDLSTDSPKSTTELLPGNTIVH